MRHSLAGLLAVACLAPPAARAAQPQFWQLEGARDFLDGETEGLSVDSEGRVRLAPATRVLQDPEAPYVWSLARDEGGRLYVGTGNDGKVFRVEGGKTSLLFDAPELEVHALAIGKDGRLYAGTAPDGKVYAIDHAGKSEVYFDPSDKYIWALAFDDQGRLLVASGDRGAHPPRHRQGQVGGPLHEPRGPHHRAGRRRRRQRVRGQHPGRRALPHRSRGQGLRAPRLRLPRGQGDGRGGRRQPLRRAHRRQGKGRQRPAERTSRAPADVVPGGRSDGHGELQPGRAAAPLARRRRRRVRSSRSAAARPRARCVRVSPTGEVDLLWTSSDEMPHALAATDDGVLVGTGNKGKLYRVRPDRSWTMIAAFPAEQVTSLVRARSGRGLPGHVEPGEGPRPGAGGRRARDVHLQGEGHRHRLQLGTRALGCGAAGRNRDPGPDAQREHGHARQHVDAVVGAVHQPPGRARGQRAPRGSCRCVRS